MEHRVTAAEAGRTVRSLLRGEMQLSYTQLQTAKWSGAITLNGQPVRVIDTVRAGDLLAVAAAEKAPVYLPTPFDFPLTIPYQDAYLLIADKPAPLSVQCSQRQPGNTLENALFSHFGCPADYVYRPVNRLDKGTSGLMAVALDAHTQQLLQRQLHTADFVRRYLAVVEGCPPEAAGTIRLPIAKAEGATVRRVISADGKPAVTHYEVVERHRSRSLLRLQLETGRTHQIRVHLQALGCPVCGDYLYGQELAELPGRFALHSADVQLRHPCTGELLRFTSPLPEELAALLG